MPRCSVLIQITGVVFDTVQTLYIQQPVPISLQGFQQSKADPTLPELCHRWDEHEPPDYSESEWTTASYAG